MDNTFLERVVNLEKITVWLEDRVWRGTGNHHERIHILEDHNGDRVHEIELLEGNIERIERTLGLNGYGDKNMLSDLRDAINTIEKIKGGIISAAEFRGVLNDIVGIQKSIKGIEEWQAAVSGRMWQIWMAIILMIIGGVWGLLVR